MSNVIHRRLFVSHTHLLNSRIAMTMMIIRMTASTGPITQSISASSLCLVMPLWSFTLSDSEKGLEAKTFCGK